MDLEISPHALAIPLAKAGVAGRLRAPAPEVLGGIGEIAIVAEKCRTAGELVLAGEVGKAARGGGRMGKGRCEGQNELFTPTVRSAPVAPSVTVMRWAVSRLRKPLSAPRPWLVA